MSESSMSLKNISVLITKGTTPTTMGKEFTDEGVTFIKAGALNGADELDESGFSHIDEETHNILRRSILEKDDILVTIAGVNVGQCGIVKEKHLPANTNQAVGIVRLNQSKANPQYVYYFLKQKRTFKYFQGLNAQAAQPNITLPTLGGIKLRLPSFQEQHRIATILSAYDDLIANNRRRMQLLEQAARHIYKEWFVRLRFPGYERTCVVDGVPEGWEIIRVSELIQRVPAGKVYDQSTASPQGTIPILDQGRTGRIGFHDDEPSVDASLQEPLIVFANHTCYQRIIHYPFSAIQNVLPFKPSEHHHRNIYWLHHATEGLVKTNAYKGHWPEFMAKEALLPPSKLCNQFGVFAADNHKLIYWLERENEKLTQARDLLLPRLMSGDISV